MPSAADVLWQPRPRVQRPTGPPFRTDHLAAPVMGTGRPAFTVKNTDRRGITTNICISWCKKDELMFLPREEEEEKKKRVRDCRRPQQVRRRDGAHVGINCELRLFHLQIKQGKDLKQLKTHERSEG